MKAWLRKNKYNILAIITLIIMILILISWMSFIDLNDWQYWAIVLCTVVFRLIGRSEGNIEGRSFMTKNILSMKSDICVSHPLQTVFKLNDISDGSFFSLSNSNNIKEPLDKYLKLNNGANDTVLAWNMTKRKYETLQNDDVVVIYSCKSIYTPKMEAN